MAKRKRGQIVPCPSCNEKINIYATDSRRDGNTFIRTKTCKSCKSKFKTIEELLTEDPQIKVNKSSKRGGKSQPFDRDKLESSIERATPRDKKNSTMSEIIDITNAVVEQIRKRFKGKKTIESKDIGWIVLETLRKKSPVAYMRYAAVFVNERDMQQLGELAKAVEEKLEQVREVL